MREKSKLEKTLDKYFDKFGENYPLVISTMKSEAEIVQDIEKCIKSNKKAEKPQYKKGADY